MSSLSMSPSSSHTTAQHRLPAYSEANGIPPPATASSSQPVSSAPSSDSFFDIAPRSDSTSFQVGYLGLKGFQAWLKGDVLVKLDTQTKNRGRYTRCLVRLQAKERAIGFYSSPSDPARPPQDAQSDEVELFSHTLVLWDAEREPTSSSAALPTLPSTMPFSFPLTEDLPHCVHLRHSSLTYTITAQLFSHDAGKLPHAVKCVPVHLVRYMRPGRLDEVELADFDGAALPTDEFTLQPHNWVEQTPTLVYAQINRTIFRRAEPIDIRVRIPPPDPASVAEKGLKLRAVEADLVRIIHVKRPARAAEGVSADPNANTASHPDAHEALLAHSGKLCRFHSQRPVLLRLTLHPPFDRANMPHPHPDHDALASGPVFGRGGGGGCESISQETLMHKVSFEVRIKIGIQGGRGEHRDITLRRPVKILPGAAGALEHLEQDTAWGNSALEEKERLKRSEKARMLADDQAAGASSSRVDASTSGLLDFGMDDEYDGYEDVGRGLHELMDAADAGSAGTTTDYADHTGRLEQLRRFLEVSDASAHDDGPPPTLLESRNDLQVEVEVQGVGFAMPRHTNRHPDDPYPDMGGMSDDAFPPPPPIDAGDTRSMGVSSSSYLLSTDMDAGADLSSHQDDPPPPLSPLMSRSVTEGGSSSGSAGLQAMHIDARSDVEHAEAYPAYLVGSASSSMQPDGEEQHPSYEAAMSGEARGAGVQHEPPPYADGSAHPDPAPSFDHAVRHAGVGATAPRSAIPRAGGRVGRADGASQVHTSVQGAELSADHRPPAYGTSPHPPSYDA